MGKSSVLGYLCHQNNVYVFKCLLMLLLALTPVFLQGQTDTVITVPAVEIKAERISKVSAASSLQVIDSLALATLASANLTELLAAESGLFFKSYGLGSLGTSTLRGGGAGHTTILWNGFNLQNPMNGVTDFSLFPVWLMDNVSLQRGGGSSLQGSGAVGGAVLIEDKPLHDSGFELKIGSSAGSFGDFRQFGSASLGKVKAGSSIKFYHQTAENDFILPGKNGGRLQNAGLEHFILTQNNQYNINKRQTLASFLWLQKTGRYIPPSITESNTHARQEDDIVRLGLAWSNVGDRAVTKVRSSYFDESIRYFSDVIDTSDSRSRTWTGEAEQAFFLKTNRIFRFGAQAIHQQAHTRETGSRQRNRLAIFTAWQQYFFRNKLSWTVDARQEITDGKRIPLVASSGADLAWDEHWKSHLRLSRNYNLPTFNDLYWQDAYAKGNPELKAETASGIEAGIKFKRQFNEFSLETNLTAFSSQVKNWILWTPGGNFWSPQNKRSVWARGLEGGLAVRRTLSSAWVVSGNLHWSLTRSTVEKIYNEEDPGLLGRQLIYTPVSNGSGAFSVNYKRSLLIYRHQFTGKRFTTTDNRPSNALDAFQTATVSLGRSIYVSPVVADVQFSVFNLWNSAYQPIAARPMPGRHFRLEIRFKFSSLKE